jgi:type I restriction enzyme S subunit
LLNSSWIKDRMVDKSRGDMIPHIVLREIRAFPVPLPPLRKQLEIVANLSELHSEISTLKRLQAESSTALEALLPSVLDRSFRNSP